MNMYISELYGRIMMKKEYIHDKKDRLCPVSIFIWYETYFAG